MPGSKSVHVESKVAKLKEKQKRKKTIRARVSRDIQWIKERFSQDFPKLFTAPLLDNKNVLSFQRVGFESFLYFFA